MIRLIFFSTISLLFPLFSEEPTPVTTKHRATLRCSSFDYTATVDSLAVQNGDKSTGSIYYIFYQREQTKEREPRPLTFCFNGGPGSSSVWLHLGAFGPKRVLSFEENQSPIPPYALVDNLDSILDITDLVFVDPVGTGFSRPQNPEDGRNFFSMEGDIQSLGDFIYDFLTKTGRWGSPKYLAGESYGALRVCGLSNYLQSRHNIYLNGLILVSPAIDYKTLVCCQDNEVAFALYFPSYAATAWHHGKLRHTSLNDAINKAEAFAFQVLLPQLFKTGSVPKHLYQQIASWTALPLSVVNKNRGLISDSTFLKEFKGSEHLTLGRYDSRCLGDSLLNATFPDDDPSFTSIAGIITASFHDYLYHDLKCTKNWPRYEILSLDVNRQWTFDSFGYPSQLESLRLALLANPYLRIFTACGYFDLATPFAASKYCLKKICLPREKNITFGYYEGGHMFYTNPSARMQFKENLAEFYQQ